MNNPPTHNSPRFNHFYICRGKEGFPSSVAVAHSEVFYIVWNLSLLSSHIHHLSLFPVTLHSRLFSKGWRCQNEAIFCVVTAHIHIAHCFLSSRRVKSALASGLIMATSYLADPESSADGTKESYICPLSCQQLSCPFHMHKNADSRQAKACSLLAKTTNLIPRKISSPWNSC